MFYKIGMMNEYESCKYALRSIEFVEVFYIDGYEFVRMLLTKFTDCGVARSALDRNSISQIAELTVFKVLCDRH